MGLSRLENFLKSVRGNILYVDPNSLDSTDSIENQGNSLTRPFKTIQRALIEAARFSYQRGLNNDKFGKTTILLYPGDHIVDNRPGWIPDGASFKLRNGTTSSDFSELTLSTDFNLESINNQLYKFNSVYGGVIIPRGTSIVGLDLRKTKIRPKYVPDPTDDNIERSAIFRVTGGCYFWQFSIFDADPNGSCYTDYDSTVALPNFSHHKLTSFEYADGVNAVKIKDNEYPSGLNYDRTDLDMYYEKIGLAYGQSSDREILIDYPSTSIDIEPKVDEYRIVGSTGRSESITSAFAVGNTITITTSTAIPELEVDTPIRISGFALAADEYNGQFVVSEKISDIQFKYRVQTAPSQTSPSTTGTTVTLVSDTVTSASPYIFNISLRSVYGMCGILADGSKASGFKSMVVAQFTGIGLQKDDDAYVLYNSTSGTYEDNTVAGNESIGTNSRAVFKPSYRNFHIKCVNEAFIQCVSIFAIGYAEQFISESGGDQSITNSNSNFGAKALVSSGFRNSAFSQDDCGYITHIIPPKEITTKEIAVEFYSIDVRKTVPVTGVGSTGRLYLYNQTNIDAPPDNIIQGYRIGAKPNDTLNLGIGNNEYSARIIIPDTDVSYEKEYYVGKNSSGINSIGQYSPSGVANVITFTGTHNLATGESIRVISDNGQLPDGIVHNTVYYAINYDSSSIKLAKTGNDAIENNPLTINQKGGTLKVVSRVSDKNSNDIGHPIQWDSTEEQWYINVSAASSENAIYSTIVGLGTTALGDATPRTYIKRRKDDRDYIDTIYRVRYVIPKNLGGKYARPPVEGFVIQESNSTTGLNNAEIATYFNTAGSTLSNLNQQRNFRFISDASWSSNTASIITELPHNLSVGNKVEIINVTSSSNPIGIANSGYNGSHVVTGISSSKHFSFSLTENPGTFTNDTSSRTTSLPFYRRKKYNNTYYVYSTEEYQPYVQDKQDGIYYLTILNSSNKPSESPFTSESFTQPVKYLYPQTNRDNPVSDPDEANSHAISTPIGEVVVDDVRKSITKETVSKILVDVGVGIGITNIVSTGATFHTVYTKTEHGLNGINALQINSGGSGYGFGSGGTFYNAKLVGFAGSVTGEGATARITVNSSGNITAVKIMDGGSAYGIGNTLSVVGVATTNTFSPAVVQVTKIEQSSIYSEVLRISGVFSDQYKKYNDIFRLHQINVGSAKSFVVRSLTPISNFTTTGVGQTLTQNAYFVPIGPIASVSDIQYNNVTGLATVFVNANSMFYVNNKVRIEGSTSELYNGEFIITKVGNPNFITINVNIGVSTSIPAVSGTILAYPMGLTSNDGFITKNNENISGRMIPIYSGISAQLSGNVTKTSTQINIFGSTFPTFNIGDYLQIDSEILRVKTSTTGSNPIEVSRGVLGTKAESHISGSLIKKILPKPIEFRRHSIIRASGHTFEYVGFGPGNYSTAFPDKQDRLIDRSEELLAQSTKKDGGVNFYTGMNDKGVSYSGNKRLSSISGQEEVIDTPVPTITGEDIGNDTSINLVNSTEANFSRSIIVNGGSDNNAISEFNGPVVFSNKVVSLSEKGLEVNSLFIQGDNNISRKYTISDKQPTSAGNPGDLVYNSNPSSNGYLGWVYTNNNEWKIFSKIGTIEDLQGVGVGTTGGFVGFSTLINFKGTNINIETNFNSSTGITTVNFIGSSVSEVLGGYKIGGSDGNWSSFIPIVSAGGTMEVGRYIDFHNTSSDTSSYTFRLDNPVSGILTAYGNLNVVPYGTGKNGDISLAGELNFGSPSSLGDRYIEFYTAASNKVFLRLLKSDSDLHNSIILNRDAGVELYFNNNKKLETTNQGINVSGLVTATNGYFSGIVTSTNLNVGFVTATNGYFSGIVTSTNLNVGFVTATNGYFSGIVTSGDFNSASDVRLKTNIHEVVDPLDKILKIRGVTFDWKESNKASIGVIAQEVEKIIPEIVSGDSTKVVNYNGLIGVLIEAIKELKSEIDELKNMR